MFAHWPHRDRTLLRWLDRAKAGDSDAFRQLYRALYPAIERYVARRVDSAHACEDILAQCFCRVIDHLGQYREDRGSVRMWVFGIARNLVADYHRQRSKVASVDPIGLQRIVGTSGEDESDPHASLVQRESYARLRERVAELPPIDREILALRFGEAMRHKDIAQLLELSEASVRQRLSRAIKQLRSGLRSLRAAKGEPDYVA